MVDSTHGERKLQLDHQIVEIDYPRLTPDLEDEQVWALLDEITATHAVDVKADPPRIIKGPRVTHAKTVGTLYASWPNRRKTADAARRRNLNNCANYFDLKKSAVM